jgi:hypothetical protein
MRATHRERQAWVNRFRKTFPGYVDESRATDGKGLGARVFLVHVIGKSGYELPPHLAPDDLRGRKKVEPYRLVDTITHDILAHMFDFVAKQEKPRGFSMEFDTFETDCGLEEPPTRGESWGAW